MPQMEWAGDQARAVVKGEQLAAISRRIHLNRNKNQQLNPLFALNRRVMVKGSLARLWSHSYKGSHAAPPEELVRPTALAMAEPAAEKELLTVIADRKSTLSG